MLTWMHTRCHTDYEDYGRLTDERGSFWRHLIDYVSVVRKTWSWRMLFVCTDLILHMLIWHSIQQYWLVYASTIKVAYIVMLKNWPNEIRCLSGGSEMNTRTQKHGRLVGTNTGGTRIHRDDNYYVLPPKQSNRPLRITHDWNGMDKSNHRYIERVQIKYWWHFLMIMPSFIFSSNLYPLDMTQNLFCLWIVVVWRFPFCFVCRLSRHIFVP